jgi:hypothetical protein
VNETIESKSAPTGISGVTFDPCSAATLVIVIPLVGQGAIVGPVAIAFKGQIGFWRSIFDLK